MDIKNIIENLGEKKEEVLGKAVQCNNAEELMALAEENGIALTAEAAAELFTTINPEASELTEDELDAVAGGIGENSIRGKIRCPICNRLMSVCSCRH